VGSTIILQAVYYNALDQPVDADSAPTVEIRDARNRPVQTGLMSTKMATGTYQAKFNSVGLQKGTYYYVFSASFDSFPDKKSATFILKDIQ
jgi:hypothetical protein